MFDSSLHDWGFSFIFFLLFLANIINVSVVRILGGFDTAHAAARYHFLF